MELSRRDRVDLAISTEINEGRGTPRGGVLLDLTHLDREVILTRLPRVYRSMLDLQMLDITKYSRGLSTRISQASMTSRTPSIRKAP